MRNAIPCLVTVIILVNSAPAGAQVRSTLGDFDLVAQRLDANGLMFNPKWRIAQHPSTLDPAKRCGILGLRGAPGYRPVLLRDPSCFGLEQRQILRLNESPTLILGGIVCGQAVNDGSPQGHLNWVPVTMEGTLMFHNKMRAGGDFDLTFEFVSDDPAPSTKWNGNKELWSRLEGTGLSPVHLEFDYRETTDRLAQGSWWSEFDRAADEPEKANAMLGTGRAIVTGLFNLDLVHYGHSEIHPIFGLAVLVHDTTIADTTMRHRWVFLARDRGNQGNCAAQGEMPFRLADSADGMNRYRFRLATPDGASGAPTIAKEDSWIGVSNRRMVGPVFEWSANEGLQVEVGWPRPSAETPDAVMMGEFVVEWTGNFTAPLAARAFAQAVAQGRTLKDETANVVGPKYYEKQPAESEEVGPVSAPRAPIESWDDWSPVVTPMESLPTASNLPLIGAEVFDPVPPVLSCSDALVKRGENPRCIGNWSVAPILGVDPLDPPGDRNLSVGVSFDNVRHYLGGPLVRFRYGVNYVWNEARDSSGVRHSEHMIAVQPTVIIGPIRKLLTVYFIGTPGLGVSRTDDWDLSVSGAVGAGFPIRTGYQVGINLELVRVWRTRTQHYWGLSLHFPIAAF